MTLPCSIQDMGIFDAINSDVDIVAMVSLRFIYFFMSFSFTNLTKGVVEKVY